MASAIIAEDDTQLREDYLEQFPDAELTLTLPGFHFYRLKLVKIRLVAGFGLVKWLTPAQLAL